MSTATAPAPKTPTATEQVLDRLQTIDKRMSAIEPLLKALEAPASKAGVTPTELLSRMVGNQQYSVLGEDGAVMPARWNPEGKRLGRVTDRETGRSATFGEWAKNFYLFAQNQYRPGKEMEFLDHLGTKRVQTIDDGMIVKTALAESSGVTGGYTVPPMFSQQLLMLALEQAIVAPKASKLPLTSRTLLVPSLDVTTVQSAGVTPFIGGVSATWTAEAATRAESEPKFRQTELTAWELSFYSLASNTLLADNAVGLDSLLTQLFSMAIAWYTDYAYLQGNGVGKPLGILNSPAAIAVSRTTSSKFQFADVGNMLRKLYWMLSDSPAIAWVIQQSVIGQLYTMNDASTSASVGRPIFIPISGGVQDKIPQPGGVQSFGTLAGYPVLITEKLPALGTQGDVILCDFSKYLLGQRMELQVDVSPHVQFLTNQMAWRVVWRGDGQPWLNSYITLQDATTQVSPFVVLN